MHAFAALERVDLLAGLPFPGKDRADFLGVEPVARLIYLVKNLLVWRRRRFFHRLFGRCAAARQEMQHHGQQPATLCELDCKSGIHGNFRA